MNKLGSNKNSGWLDGDKVIPTFKTEEYLWLSNMWVLETPIIMNSVEYYSSENLYQALKTPHEGFRKYVSTLSPQESKKLKLPRHAHALLHMKHAVREKFRNNPILLNKLLETDGYTLVEGNNWKDEFWGVNLKTGLGRNNLGVILMEIREEALNELRGL